MKTNELVAALRRLADPFGCIGKCGSCAYRAEDAPIGDDFEVCDRVRLYTDAADRMEELVDRCARYAEEIAVLRERRKRVPVVKRLPERDGKYLCWYRFEPHQNVLFCQVLDYYATDPNPHFQHEGMNGMTVTHWMEISEEQA